MAAASILSRMARWLLFCGLFIMLAGTVAANSTCPSYALTDCDVSHPRSDHAKPSDDSDPFSVLLGALFLVGLGGWIWRAALRGERNPSDGRPPGSPPGGRRTPLGWTLLVLGWLLVPYIMVIPLLARWWSRSMAATAQAAPTAAAPPASSTATPAEQPSRLHADRPGSGEWAVLSAPVAVGRARPAGPESAKAPPGGPHAAEVTATRKARVFLCHASEDKAQVRDVFHRLVRDGFDPWLDEEKLLPGQRWREEIARVVSDSDAILVCLSNHAVNKTGFVQREVARALDLALEQPEGKIFLIPARLESCAIPQRLADWHYVDLFQPGGYDKLVAALPQSVPA